VNRAKIRQCVSRVVNLTLDDRTKHTACTFSCSRYDHIKRNIGRPNSLTPHIAKSKHIP